LESNFDELTPSDIHSFKRTIDAAVAISPLILLIPESAGKTHGKRLDLVEVRGAFVI
jgi:hypothetical protein